MKKFLFFVVALLCSFGAAMAQVNYVATLQHGDAITHYYGGAAFEQAYNASEDGDTITLSSGTFSFGVRKFQKGITVRGTGIDATQKTYISGDVDLDSSSDSKVATLEGLVFNNYVRIYNNAGETSHGKINFIKNRFSSYVEFQRSTNPYPTLNGPVVRFYDSIIDYYFTIESSTHPDCILYNCYVKDPRSYLTTSTTSTFVNCVINLAAAYSNNYTNYLNFFNCIFIWTNSSWGGSNASYLPPSTTTCYNCLSINKSTLFNNIVSGTNNKYINTAAEVFKTYSNGYNSGETFELTDVAKETYIGTDGTQIGMQGGLYPYSSTVQYPIITKFESAPQTTKEGKLSIDVQVDGK